MVIVPVFALVFPFKAAVRVITPLPLPVVGVTLIQEGKPDTFQLLFEFIAIVWMPPTDVNVAVPVPTLTVGVAPDWLTLML